VTAEPVSRREAELAESIAGLVLEEVERRPDLPAASVLRALRAAVTMVEDVLGDVQAPGGAHE
jgi:hypothetical protein